MFATQPGAILGRSLAAAVLALRVVVFLDRQVEDGRATFALGSSPRQSTVRFEARLDDIPGSRDGRATARLRPDLRVAAVSLPPQTLTTKPVDVVVDLEEALKDSEVEATLTLLQGGIPVTAPKTVRLGSPSTRCSCAPWTPSCGPAASATISS